MELISQKRADLTQQLDDIQAVLVELDGLEANCKETLAKIDK